MKSITKYIIPLCILLASCSSESEEPFTGEPREIGFSASNIPATRATGDMEPLNPDYKMWVTSIYHGTQNNEYNYYLTDAPFESKAVGTQTIWTANGGAYYPLSGTLDFVAYASKNGAHKPQASYSIQEPGANSSSQPYLNVLYLDYRDSGLDGTDDVLVSQVSPNAPCGKSAQSVVPLEFIHLLSNIRFEFPGKTEDTQLYMKVTGVELNNVRLSGKAELRINDNKNWNLKWKKENLSEPAAKVFRRTDASPAFDGTVPLEIVDFYLPPQELTNDAAFTIYYKYKSASNETVEMPYLGKVFCDIGTEKFEAGKRYVYNVKCKILPTIEFNISLVDEDGIVIDEWIIEDEIKL